MRAKTQYMVATNLFLPISKQDVFPFLLYVKKKTLILILGPNDASYLFFKHCILYLFPRQQIEWGRTATNHLCQKVGESSPLPEPECPSSVNIGGCCYDFILAA